MAPCTTEPPKAAPARVATSILASGAGSTVNLTDGLFASADGFGGDYVGEGIPTAATGGDGRGGFSFIQLDGGAFTAGGSFELTADAFGGAGRDGGLAFGGNAGVFGPGGSANLGPNLFLSPPPSGATRIPASAAGAAMPLAASPTFRRTVRWPTVTSRPPSRQSRAGPPSLTWKHPGVGVATATGPRSRQVGAATDGGVYDGTVASGGAFTLANTAGGTLTLTDVELFSAGFGGDGGDGGSGQIGGSGGDGYGGLSQAGPATPLQSSSGVANFGNVILDSSASGGRGGIGDADNGGAPDGTGGNAFAGGTYVCAGSSGTCGGSVLNAGGTVHVTGFAELISDASGGTGGIGGNAFGGFSVIHSLPNSLLDLAAGADLISTASGGSGTSTGGNATGGSSVAQADPGSTLTVHGFALAEFLGNWRKRGDRRDGHRRHGSRRKHRRHADLRWPGIRRRSAATPNSMGSSDGPTEIVATNGGTINLGVAILGLDPNIGSVSLTAGDATTPGTIIASSLTINAHDISLNALRGAINVTGGLQARANGNFLLSDNHALGTFTVRRGGQHFAAGLADFQGTVRAPTIIVTSGDLNIATGASLRSHGTYQSRRLQRAQRWPDLYRRWPHAPTGRLRPQ